MSSWLVRFFMNLKVENTIDEACQKHKRTLDLSNTNLKRMPKITRLYHSQVCQLLLQKNYLNEIPEDFGLTMKKLNLLTLDYNELTELPTSFSMLENLTFLNISNNSFTTFPLPICSLTNLRTLWANRIGIKEIPNEIKILTRLRFLGLRNNSLTEISQGICILKKLKWLTFENNKIEYIPFEICNLKGLIHLNLNFNQIVTFPKHICSSMIELKYLFLQSNLLQVNDFVVQQIQQFPKLKKADLTGNHWTNNEFYNQIITPRQEVEIILDNLPQGNSRIDEENEIVISSTLNTSSPVLAPFVTVNSNTTEGLSLRISGEDIPQHFQTADKCTQFSNLVDSSTSTGDFGVERLFDDEGISRVVSFDLLENPVAQQAIYNFPHLLIPEVFENDEIYRNDQQAQDVEIIHAQVSTLFERNNAQQIEEENFNSNRNAEAVVVGRQNSQVQFENSDDADLFDMPQASWEFSENTVDLDNNITVSDDSDIEEIPLDAMHAMASLWGILIT